MTPMLRSILACLLLSVPASARAEGFSQPQRAEIVQVLRDALHTDPSILRDAIAALQQDDAARQDAAARSLVSAQHAALSDPADPAAGNPAGDVTVVEFYDTRCPYCRRMIPTLAALLLADPGVRLIYKDLPILGPASTMESQALLAAQRQGGYTRLQDALMRSTGQPTPDSIRTEADRQGLDGDRLLRDMADPAIKARLDANIQLAQTLHIEGTPALIVGQQMIPGAVNLADLRKAVADARH